jgi:hypothetical protein
MRLLSTAICTTVTVALLAGCSGNASQTNPSGPSAMGQTQIKHLHQHHRPQWTFPANLANDQTARPWYRQTLGGIRRRSGTAPSKGMYVSEFYGSAVLAYENRNTSNNPPVCSVPTGADYVNGIAIDGQGNLITPLGSTPSGYREVEVWQGPSMCGSPVGTLMDPYGQPSDAASQDAIHGTIAVANIFGPTSSAGSVSVCTLSGGCTANLTNAAMYKVAGVAIDKSGNCWASAEDSTGVGTLTYFAGCAGSGQQATGFMNVDYGGLDIDANGNLVSVDKAGQQLWIYSGCNPACTLVGGPFPLQGESVFGAVNRQSMTFMAGNSIDGQVDVYYYSPAALTYWYSYNNGLNVTYTVEGVAYNPRSKQ